MDKELICATCLLLKASRKIHGKTLQFMLRSKE
jgi:hypothetical protein